MGFIENVTGTDRMHRSAGACLRCTLVEVSVLKWEEVRNQYPDQWVLVEAFEKIGVVEKKFTGIKRTSTLCANKILVGEGKGILSVPEKHIREFNTRLSDFYNTGDYGKIDGFVYDNC